MTSIKKSKNSKRGGKIVNKKEAIYWVVGMLLAVAGIFGVITAKPTFVALGVMAIFTGGIAVSYIDPNKKEKK